MILNPLTSSAVRFRGNNNILEYARIEKSIIYNIQQKLNVIQCNTILIKKKYMLYIKYICRFKVFF